LRAMQSAAQFQANPSAQLDASRPGPIRRHADGRHQRGVAQARHAGGDAAPYVQLATFEGEPGTGKLTWRVNLFSRSPFFRNELSASRCKRVAGDGYRPGRTAGFTYLDRVDLLRRQGRACCCAF